MAYQIFTGTEASKHIEEGMLEVIKTGKEYMQSYAQKYTNKRSRMKKKVSVREESLCLQAIQ